jgi:hypothetical protein
MAALYANRRRSRGSLSRSLRLQPVTSPSRWLTYKMDESALGHPRAHTHAQRQQAGGGATRVSPYTAPDGQRTHGRRGLGKLAERRKIPPRPQLHRARLEPRQHHVLIHAHPGPRHPHTHNPAPPPPPPPPPRIHTMSTCYLQGQRQTGDRPVGRRDGRDGSAVDGEEGEYTARGPKGRTVASSGRRGPRHVCDRDNVALWFICQ